MLALSLNINAQEATKKIEPEKVEAKKTETKDTQTEKAITFKNEIIERTEVKYDSQELFIFIA